MDMDTPNNNCPDCQLQMLQEQSQEASSGTSSIPNISGQCSTQQQGTSNEIPIKDHQQNDTTAVQLADQTPHFSQGTSLTHYQSVSISGSSPFHSRSVSSATCGYPTYPNNNTNSPCTTLLGSNGATLIAPAAVVSISEPIVPSNVTPSSSTSTMAIPSQSYGDNNTSSLALISSNNTSTTLEQCEYSGYCSTCGVLDLPHPSNDKFYRSTGGSSRHPSHHVFPPIFYAQGSSSVIPCFSPIPDSCNPWNNEYNPYAYASSYPQGPSSMPTPSEYYGYSNVPIQPSSASPYETVMHGSTSSNLVSTSAQYSISSVQQKYTSLTTTRHDFNNAYSSASKPNIRIDDFVEPQQSDSTASIPPSEDHSHENQNEVSIEVSSASCSLGDSESDSSCDSDIDDNSSLQSDDRELISVVEEDEREQSNIKSPVRHISSEKERNDEGSCNKCWICQGALTIDCSSPQLAKILENIDTDISAEDLDITVSSVDIEIEGIEDDEKSFTLHQRKQSTSNGLSFSRLKSLIGQVNGFEEKCPLNFSDADFVPLCDRCVKMACLADSLERQLTGIVQILNQLAGEGLALRKAVEFLAPSNNASDSFLLCQNGIRRTLFNTTKSSVETQTESESNGPQCIPVCPNLSDLSLIISPNVEKPHDSGEATSNADVNEKSQDARINIRTEFHSEPDNSSKCNSQHGQEFTSYFSKRFQDAENDEDTQNALNENELQNLEIHDCSPTTEILISDQLQHSNVEHPIIINCTTRPCSNENIEYDESVKKDRNVPLVEADPKTCSYCKRKFTTKSNLKAHIEICKFRWIGCSDNGQTGDIVGKGATKCWKCGLGFRSSIRWRKHMDQGCRSVVFECSYCPQRFSKNSELKTHITVHSKQKSFKCDFCCATFATKGNQVAHSRTHLTAKKFVCNLCDKGFNRRFALTVHQNRHKGKGWLLLTVLKVPRR
jgi:hypothetical protein